MSATSDRERNERVWQRRKKGVLSRLRAAVFSVSLEEWRERQECLRRERKRKRDLVFSPVWGIGDEEYPVTDKDLFKLSRR